MLVRVVEMFLIVLCLLMFSTQCVLSQDQLTIGGIFYETDTEFLKQAFQVSAAKFEYKASIKEVSKRGEILEITQHVCSLAEEGVIGIIDGTGGRASEHIQALCDMLELPHVIIQQNDHYTRNWSLVNMTPSPAAYNMVLESLITLKDWNNFTVLFVKGHSLKRVEQLLKMGNDTDRYSISTRELSGSNYRDVLINAKESGYYNFVVDCPSSNLEQLLQHSQQVGLMAELHSYIVVSPDLFTLDLSRFRYGGVNMTGFRLIKLTENVELQDFTTALNNDTGEESTAEQLKTKVLLVYDAVKVFYEAIKKIKNVSTTSLSCENYETWSQGSTLLNFMKTNKVEGLTGLLVFDGSGQRTDVSFDLLELTPAGNQTIGTWEVNALKMSRSLLTASEASEESLMINKTFRVLIAMTPPYAYMKESSEKLEGNDQYEGFSIDLIARLGEILGFSFEFEVEQDYGKKENGKWTGMVKLLAEDKADFAICDLTITAEKQSAIEFSTPFMNLGIGILYKEPSKQPPEMFSFMAVFSKEGVSDSLANTETVNSDHQTEQLSLWSLPQETRNKISCPIHFCRVWYYMMFVQAGIGVIMIFVGRISNKEWQNPVPCIESPEELSNQFSLANSIWLIIGSVMQQGSEIAPIALGPRLITSVWWFFTMVMVASYVGTLVAFLTVEKNVLPFDNVDALADHKSISYGAKKEGSTLKFFQNSTSSKYRKMFEKMSQKNWLVEGNDAGVNRAKTETYAFFMESTTIEYYKERNCDLLQIGGLLDSKSYGIGMKKGSPYKKFVDDALLKLKENGELQKMKDLWWKENRGGGKCGEKRNEEPKQLGMKNMIGSFVVLGVGSAIGIVISIFDMLWGVFKRTVKYNTTFKYELVEELKFALKFSGDIKPVKRPPKSDGSNEALAEAEAEAEKRDELGSLRSAVLSLRSGRSTSTHRSHHSHSSRHSPSALSVAFARRRQYS